MSKKFSAYLKDKIGLLERLIDELKKDYPYCSILGCDSKGLQAMVSTRTTNVGENRLGERGFVLRIHNGINYAEYSFNEISEDLIPEIIEKVRKELVIKENYKHADFISLEKYKVLVEESMTKDFARVYDGKECTFEDVISELTKIKEKIQAKDNVINALAALQSLDISKVFISNQKKLTQFYSWATGNIQCLVTKDNDTRYCYSGASGVEPWSIFPELMAKVDDICEKAISLINTKGPKPGVYDIVATPEVTGLIAHEAFGHGVEMDMFVKKRAKAVEYLNKKVASEHVTMHEGAKGEQLEVSSYFFDDEGVLAHDTIEIKNGILQTGVSDVISALILGTEPTGNGKRESFERKAYSRMTATYFEPGNSTVEEMIASIKDGFLIDVGYSGMEDPKNWGIQCATLLGREIKDGKLTGKVVSPVMMTGYVPDLLGSISMLSKKVELFGTGYCGKGYKEWVKVSDGGPYLKARVSIG